MFGASCQTTNAHPIFEGLLFRLNLLKNRWNACILLGFNANGSCSLFRTPTETSIFYGGLIGRQNASMGKKTGVGWFDSSNSKTSLKQSKPVGSPLTQLTRNIFAKLQTSTAGNTIFGTSTTGNT